MAAVNWAPLLSFAFLLFSSTLCKLLSRFLRGQGKKLQPAEEQLSLEIRDLLRQASSLSTPSTFAKAAKLKRAAAAKEKELAHLKKNVAKEQGWLKSLHVVFPTTVKALTYLSIGFWLWGCSIASVPFEIIRPFDTSLLWRNKSNDLGNHIMIGVFPWLVVCSRVVTFISNKLLPD